MADTTRDVIKALGDTLTELDILAASPDLGEEDFVKVRKQRKALDRQQLELVKASFRENTLKFQNASKAVGEVNLEVKKTIADVTKVAETLAAVASLVSSVGKLISIAIP